MGYLALACQSVMVLVFTVSALSKVAGRAAFMEFVAMVRDTGLVPRHLHVPVAAGIVAVECAVPVVLIAAPAAGFAIATVLLLLFSGVSVVMIRLRRVVRCRCFGQDKLPMGPTHLIRNALMASTCAVGAVTVLTGTTAPAHPAGAALALTAGLVVAALLIRFTELMELFSAS